VIERRENLPETRDLGTVNEQIWQFSISAKLRKRRTLSGCPLICSSRTASSRRAPKGSLPRMPMTNGSFGWANAWAGHSTKREKVIQKKRLELDFRSRIGRAQTVHAYD